jgi:hypothetical protein
MTILKTGLLGAAAALAVASTAAKADVLVLNGGWDTFYFQGANINANPPTTSPFQDLSANPLEFDFTLSGPAFLKVTDAFYTGDRFDITINGVDQGPTSPRTFDVVYTDSFDSAFHNPSFSSAYYYLPDGSYTVTGLAINSPYGSGAGGIELSSNIPEPAGWALMLTGLAGVGGMARNRRRAATAA